MQMPAGITVKSPQDASSVELRDFAAFVLAGGEVMREGLEARVSRAYALLFLRENACLVGITALKTPSARYRASVFKKAGATVSPSQYALELGWTFVMPSARGKNFSHDLARAAIDYAGQTRIFATSRTDNPAMHATLLAASFKKHGHVYASNRGAHRLELFVRDL